MSKTAIVLQARMGSARLPVKVLAQVAGRTVLAHCVERLQACSGLPVVVATTDLPDDDRLVAEALRLGTIVVRGAAEDVLARYLQAASQLSLTEIVWASADNPAVDMDAPRRTLELLRRSGADHITEYGLPEGTAVEALTTAALAKAARTTTSARDREQVTRCMRRDSRLFALAAIAPGSVRCPAVRLTVETPADLAFIRRVFGLSGATPGAPTPLADLIAAAERAMATAVPESANAADLRYGQQEQRARMFTDSCSMEPAPFKLSGRSPIPTEDVSSSKTAKDRAAG